MTNAEKYLKDGVDIGQLAKKLGFFLENTCEFNWQDSIANYFKQKAKPTLTEDERAILSNIDENEYQKIARQDGALLLIGENAYGGRNSSFMFGIIFKSNLFQFIKNGEEYSIEELLGND